MCGISGYIGSLEISAERVEKCLGLMERRGPDARGVYRHSFNPARNVCLLHSRLSIIDLNARADQPFHLGQRVMVYNGELYNYLELKQDCKKAGERFETQSDTEVLLKVLCSYGDEGLDKCEGMWAFAVYDENDGSLLLSRDRFGEKPLYIYRDRTGLYFGSEPKFIFALIGQNLSINFNHLYRYMINGYKALYKSKESFFFDLEELQAGHVLRIDSSNKENLARYWTPDLSPLEDLSLEEALSGIRDLLIHSVKLRLRSDVPLAFCMSGGIDSNCLISIARRVLKYDVHGFTIVNSDERYAEQDMVNHAVNKLKIKHTTIPLPKEAFLSNLSTLIRYHDAPVYTISYYVHWILMRHIRENGYKVSFSGTGGDELFSGYYDHHALYLREIMNDAELYKKSLENWMNYIKPIVRNPYLQNPNIFVDDPEFRDHIFLYSDQLASYLKQGWSESFSENKYPTSLLRMRMLNELFYESIPVILHEDDLNAMYFSIENRSPFLDRNLFEFSLRIPTRHLIRNGYTKAVLRESMRGIVPDKILDCRRKVGFNAPILELLDINDPTIREQLLDNGPIYEHIRREMIESLFTKKHLPNSESKFLFYFLCSRIFLEEFSA